MLLLFRLKKKVPSLLRIPASNHAFALLIGDANAAIPCEIRLDKNRSRVIGTYGIEILKQGGRDRSITFIHIHDEQHHCG